MNMVKPFRLLIVIPFCFTVLVLWFAWSAFHAAPQLAAENLRGAGLSISASIEQMAVSDPALRSLARYSAPDVAYFALVDRQGTIRFHTNSALIGQEYSHIDQKSFHDGISEQREFLGTGEEVYLLHTNIHADHDQFLLVLALHTYRADQVIRRAKAGVSVVSALTIALWGLTLILFFMLRREERHQKEMSRREELARLGEMGAVLAHEIRNPLAGIKGFAQLVETAGDLEQARRHAGKIVTQSLRMEALVSDLLAFARDDQGERHLMDLSGMIQECVALIQVEAAIRNVKIEVHTSSSVRTHIIADRIIQMLLNLIKNAIQAVPDSGIVMIGLWQKSGLAHISIKDNGCGITPDQLKHIFDPFWTSKAQGTGLGLALCKKVVEEHDGRLSVESSVGIGTEFVVILPVVT